MQFFGVRMMNLEGSARKESIAAISYASGVISTEVHEKLMLTAVSEFSPVFNTLEQTLTYALESVYTEDVWNEYLKRAGLRGKSKKEAEVFINACATKFVCIVLHPLLVLCRENVTGLRAGLAFKRAASDVNDALDLALNILSRYPDTAPRYTFKQFEQEYPNVIASLLESLQ